MSVGGVMGLFELVLFACLMGCNAVPLDTRLTDSTPSIDKHLHDFNSVELTNHVVGDIIAAVCGLKRGVGDEGVVRDKVTRVFCDAIGEIEAEDYVDEPDLPISEPTKQVIFVEVPVMAKVRVPPPPQVTVYVLPPEENHVYRVFDMRGRGEGVTSVRFLSGVVK